MKLTLANRAITVPRSLILLTLIGIIGVGGVLAFRLNAPQSSRRNSRAMTVPAEVQNLNVRIRASGTVTPMQAVNISPKNSGRLAELYVDQGDRVQQGQVIARMDDRELQAQLAQAQASVAQAQARLLKARNGNLPEEIAQAQGRVASAQAQAKLTQERSDRNRQLYQQGAISRDQYDGAVADNQKAIADLQVAEQSFEQTRNGTRVEDVADAEAAVAQAQAQVQALQVQVQDTVIRAPFSGIITQKYASVGAFVTPTTSASATSSATSASIVALASDFEVVANVAESDIQQVHSGQAVEIRADAYPGKRFRGKVRLVAPEAVVNNNVTSFQVRVALDKGQTDLKSGMNVDLQFEGDRLKNAVVVPTVAIVSEKGQTGVLVAGEDQKPQFRSVTIGVSAGDKTQVVQGLNAGDQVYVYVPGAARRGRDGGGRSGPPIRFR